MKSVLEKILKFLQKEVERVVHYTQRIERTCSFYLKDGGGSPNKNDPDNGTKFIGLFPLLISEGSVSRQRFNKELYKKQQALLISRCLEQNRAITMFIQKIVGNCTLIEEQIAQIPGEVTDIQEGPTFVEMCKFYHMAIGDLFIITQYLK